MMRGSALPFPGVEHSIPLPLLVTKDCFPSPSKCHNCERKETEAVKTDTDPKEEYKRCAGCHLLTYCDKDCQKEHWKKVHKKHCRFLSGKVPVKNSKHNAVTCARCIDQNQASPTQLSSENSPKTICNIEQDDIAMKKALGDYFSFHRAGKKCDCSLEYGLELPFPLGEVSGQYVEIGSTGIDAILAHALKILAALVIKAKKGHINALRQLWIEIIGARSQLWYDILVRGMPISRSREHLSEQVDRLENIYGPSNPWWKTLNFTVEFIVKTYRNLASNFYDYQSLEDLRFQKYKLVYEYHEYQQSQLQNQAKVCDKTWANFMLWPGLVNGSLSVLLPSGTRCQSCYDELGGEVAVTTQEFNSKTLPVLMSEISDNGALMACCSVVKNPNCLVNCLNKDVAHQISSDEEQRKKLVQEADLFIIESRDCDLCLKMSLSSHRCSDCLTVQYCSPICQKEDLEFHKSVCSTWAKDKSRKIFSRRKQKDYRKSFVGKL